VPLSSLRLPDLLPLQQEIIEVFHIVGSHMGMMEWKVQWNDWACIDEM
jgi:hypothetical protein